VNDQVDRHFSRFPHRELRTISRMIVGKPLMVNHDMPGGMSRGSLPRGTFFRGRFQRGADGARAAGDSSNARAVGEAYILNTSRNRDFIEQMKGGVYRGTSIGFSFDRAECSICHSDMQKCAHWPGVEYDEDRCHYIMHDVSDVYEQGVVPLGAQSTEVLAVRGVGFTNDSFIQSLRDSGKRGQDEFDVYIADNFGLLSELSQVDDRAARTSATLDQLRAALQKQVDNHWMRFD